MSVLKKDCSALVDVCTALSAILVIKCYILNNIQPTLQRSEQESCGHKKK